MKNFYFNIQATANSNVPGYFINCSNIPLGSGEKGEGSYLRFAAENLTALQNDFRNQDFTTLTLVVDPIGE